MKLYGTSSITVVTESVSVNSVPNAGGIFLSASSIYMKNYDNEVYDLTDTNGFMRVTVYTSSGNYSRPGNIAYLQIVCIGAGGGGGAGARNTTGNQRGGGGGGGGGAIVQRWFTSGSLPPGIYTVTVGASGSGGITGSTAGISAAGGNGSIGGFSRFALGSTIYLNANGGNLGAGSTVAGVGNGGTEQTTVIVSQSGAAVTMYRLVGMNGGTGGVLAQSSKTPNSGQNGNSPNIHGTNFLPIYAFAGNQFGSSLPFDSGLSTLNYQGGCWYGVGGGGAGGHISSSNIAVDGGMGAAAYIWSNLTPAGNSGSIGQNGGDGTNNIVNGNFLIAASSSYFPTASVGPGSPGGGGGPGDITGTINGGKGGEAGDYGAGGGGGGGATNPAQAGNGGSGGGGCVIIFEYY
jgi:hypothetical protein